MTVKELRELLASLKNQDYKLRVKKYIDTGNKPKAHIALVVNEDIQLVFEVHKEE